MKLVSSVVGSASSPRERNVQACSERAGERRQIARMHLPQFEAATA